ncbi:MAG: 2-dehydropantoate 2-reductase [Patiriisocius sp.]|jgi:2-dehydropantoate 2-reductase
MNLCENIPFIVLRLKLSLRYWIITIKEHQYQAARSQLKKLIGKNTLVFVIRNGLKLKESVSGIVLEDNVRECIIDCSVQALRNGGYKQYSNLKLTLSASKHATELRDIFLQEADVFIAPNFHSALWKKVCLSSSIGGLLCLANDTCVIFKTPKMLNKLRLILKESIAVAKKDGADIEDGFQEEAIKIILAYPESKGSSMLTDMRLGKNIELGAKNGVIQSIAKAYGMSSLLNDEVCSFILTLKT